MTDKSDPMETLTKDDCFLPPIEKPRGLMMKLAYAITRRKNSAMVEPLPRDHSIVRQGLYFRF